ncbi:DUF5615 family PIN-like protein [Pleurocapsales cyanobacterium LEGE 10410]|nr:DUF5615 family PIN-like protein [Pleurocapsales cyanobacterium LEGE 10410]
MKIRYQADADLNQNIVSGVIRREPAIDFQTAPTAKLEGVKDIEVLSIAAQQKRILISHDRKTMPSEFAQFIIDNQSSGVIIETIILIWAVSSAEEWIDRIAKIPL